MSKARKPRHLSDTYLHQISVLKTLCGESSISGQFRSLEITEIAERSGLADEKEALRYLYILEGAKLVSPNPPGDFTSKLWRATEDGLKAFKTMAQEAVV